MQSTFTVVRAAYNYPDDGDDDVDDVDDVNDVDDDADNDDDDDDDGRAGAEHFHRWCGQASNDPLVATLPLLQAPIHHTPCISYIVYNTHTTFILPNNYTTHPYNTQCQYTKLEASAQ